MKYDLSKGQPVTDCRVAMRKRLDGLRDEHAKILTEMESLQSTKTFAVLRVKKYKTRKSMLETEIGQLEADLYPDIVA